MKNLYRYRVEPFHWMFTNFLKSSATMRYDLTYSADERRFAATRREREDATRTWSRLEECGPQTIEKLRALLEPQDLAACAAASMVRVDDETA